MEISFNNKPDNPALSEKKIDRKEHGYFLRPSSTTDERWFIAGQVTWISPTTLTGTLNDTVKLQPFIIESTTIIDKISVNMTVGGTAASSMRYAIYDSNDELPNYLIFDSGDIDSVTTGIKTITFSPLTLKPGLYWMGWNTNSVNGLLTLSALVPGGVFPILGLPSTIGNAFGINLSYAYTFGQFEQNINNTSFTIGTTSNIMFGIRIAPIN